MQRPAAVLLLSFDSLTALAESTLIENEQSGPKHPEGTANRRSPEVAPAARPLDDAVTGTGLPETLKVTSTWNAPAAPAP